MNTILNTEETSLGTIYCTKDVYNSKHWQLKSEKYHRENGPAVEYSYEDKYWYYND